MGNGSNAGIDGNNIDGNVGNDGNMGNGGNAGNGGNMSNDGNGAKAQLRLA